MAAGWATFSSSRWVVLHYKAHTTAGLLSHLPIRRADLTKLQPAGSGDDDPSIRQCCDSSAACKCWRRMIYGWPIVIICLEWKLGCSMISSGGPLFGILTALCLEMRLHFCRSYSQIPTELRLCFVPPDDLFSPKQSHLISTSGGTMSGRHVLSHYPGPFINVL